MHKNLFRMGLEFSTDGSEPVNVSSTFSTVNLQVKGCLRYSCTVAKQKFSAGGKNRVQYQLQNTIWQKSISHEVEWSSYFCWTMIYLFCERHNVKI